MKKILILTIMLFTALASTAFADSIETVNISRNDNGAVVISGNLDVSKTNQQLILTVTNQGTLITAEQTTVKNAIDGKAQYEFDALLFPYDAPSGNYTYTVSGRYIDAPMSKTEDVMYISTNDFYARISALNSKIQSGNQDEAYNYLLDNSAYLSVDGTQLSSINKALPVFKKLLMDKQFVCTEGDYASIENARSELIQRYNEIISICMFYQINSLTSYNSWLENFSREFPDEEKDGAMYPYYTRIKSKQTVADKTSYLINAYVGRNIFGTFAEEKENIKRIFYEAVKVHKIGYGIFICRKR